MIGYASTGRPVQTRLLLGLLLVALCFHIAVFALNDIFDLDIDRTNPERASSPLVAGLLSTRTAYAIIGAVVLAGFLLDTAFFGGSATAFAALCAGYAGLGAYDVFTKRLPMPVLTDTVQGLGWGALVVYGAVRAGGPTVETALSFAFVLLFVVMVNGVHGGLRDLRNDLSHESHTTAIHLGARPTAHGVFVPLRLRGYCWALQGGMAVVAAVPARLPHLGWYTAGLALTALAMLLCWLALRATEDGVRLKHLGATHILVGYLPVTCMAAATASWRHGIAAAAVMLVPMLGNSSFLAAFRAVPALMRNGLTPAQLGGSPLPSSGNSGEPA